jgi:CBS domain-containing protein
MSTISTLMNQVVTVSPTDTIAMAAQRMAERGVGVVVVVEAGKPPSLCSERDIVQKVIAAGKDPATTMVRQVATTVGETVTPDTRMRRCAEVLRSGGYRYLPVVVDGRPVGVVSARDFFEQVVGHLEQLVDHEKYRKELGDGVDPYDHPGGSYGH